MGLGKDFHAKYGPTAVVTGTSSGIGEQFARLLAADGFDLILVARRTERIEKLAAELSEKHSIEAEAISLDLARPDFLAPLLAACQGKDVGLVVSNAGAGAKGLLHETEIEDLLTVLDVNCRAPLLLAHAFSPRLIERGRGGFLITASMESFVAFPYSAGYAASKAFALSFGEAIWSELRERGVDVLVLAPGPTDTEILPNQGIRPQDMTGLMSAEEGARIGLEQLGRRPVYIPGLLNRLMVGFLSRLPRRLALKAAGSGMRAAIEKGRASP